VTGLTNPWERLKRPRALADARRIGLLGGTFDPPHFAHLALARAALETLNLSELHWLPAGKPWQKQGRQISAPEHRMAMVKAAIADERRYVLDAREVLREGPTYTIDTVEELQARAALSGRRARWFLIIGADQLARFHTWHRWSELLQRVTLAVAQRPGAVASAHPQVRSIDWEPIHMPQLHISSTEIRRRVAAGETIAEMVPPDVARYIDEHQLYREDAEAAH
jgi:nicotinate-nucleotide adenylyltransferase